MLGQVIRVRVLKSLVKLETKILKLPEPIINKAGCNLSFAGLKTAVLRETKKINGEDNLKYNLAASFKIQLIKFLQKN